MMIAIRLSIDIPVIHTTAHKTSAHEIAVPTLNRLASALAKQPQPGPTGWRQQLNNPIQAGRCNSMTQDPLRTAAMMSTGKLAQVEADSVDLSSAWLDKTPADVGAAHLVQLARLHNLLAANNHAYDDAQLSTQLKKLSRALTGLEFTLVQPLGVWARLMGEQKKAAAKFSDQFEKIAQCNNDVTTQAGALHERLLGESATTERWLMEMEVEQQAVSAIVEQGTHWLGAMRGQLKERHAAATDAEAQQAIKAEAARCESLVLRMRSLRAISTTAGQVIQITREAAEQRSDLRKLLQQALMLDMKTWHLQLSSLVAAMRDAGGRKLGIDNPTEAHRDLQQRVADVCTDCEILRKVEAVLTNQLAELAQQLKAAQEA